MTAVYYSGRKHSDNNCLSRAPVELASERTGDDDGVDNVFIGAVSIKNKKIETGEKERTNTTWQHANETILSYARSSST